MSKKAKHKKNLDPFTNANDIQDIQKGLVDKKKGKRTPQEKNRRDRHQQKEIVRQLTDELVRLSEKDILEELSKEEAKGQVNEVIYTIRPVKSKDDL